MTDYLQNYYLSQITLEAILFSAIVLVSFLYLIARIATRKMGDEVLLSSTIVLGGLGLYVFSVANFAFGFMPEFPDEIKYFGLLTGRVGVSAASISYISYTDVLSLLDTPSFHSPAYIVVLNLIALMIGLLAWGSATYEILKLEEVMEKGKYLAVFLVLCTVYPATIVYMTRLLRESFIVASVGVSIWTFQSILKGNLRRYEYVLLGLVLVLALLLTLKLRPQFLFYIAVVFSVIFFAKHTSVKNLIIAAVFGSGTMAALIVRFNLTKYLSPETVALLRNYRIELYPDQAYGVVEWNSWFDIILDIPYLASAFLFSPLGSANRMQFASALVDVAFVIGVVVASAISLRRFRQLRSKQTLLWTIGIVLCVMLMGIYEFRTGAAVRHRIVLVLAIIPLSVPGMIILLDAMLVKISNVYQFPYKEYFATWVTRNVQ